VTKLILLDSLLQENFDLSDLSEKVIQVNRDGSVKRIERDSELWSGGVVLLVGGNWAG